MVEIDHKNGKIPPKAEGLACMHRHSTRCKWCEMAIQCHSKSSVVVPIDAAQITSY